MMKGKIDVHIPWTCISCHVKQPDVVVPIGELKEAKPVYCNNCGHVCLPMQALQELLSDDVRKQRERLANANEHVKNNFKSVKIVFDEEGRGEVKK